MSDAELAAKNGEETEESKQATATENGKFHPCFASMIDEEREDSLQTRPLRIPKPSPPTIYTS